MAMTLLVINFGSSSLKLAVFRKGECQLVIKRPKEHFEKLLREIFESFPIDVIAHRFVHGGIFDKPLIINSKKDLAPLKKILSLAPLHNPLSYKSIETCLSLFSAVNVAVFDTSFFHNLPMKAQKYALPKQMTEKYGIRRYGFHGLAHEALLKSVKWKRVITAHLGSGASMAAHLNGQPIDISMGFTPLEGLVMATRAGDVDPGLIAFLSQREDLEKVLNYESGLKGLSGHSDMAELIKTDSESVDIYCYRAQKYIGAYIAALGGLDVLVFSGGVGENAPFIRKELCPSWFGAQMDASLNKKVCNIEAGESFLVSSKNSSIKIYVVGSNENQMIALHAEKALRNSKRY